MIDRLLLALATAAALQVQAQAQEQSAQSQPVAPQAAQATPPFAGQLAAAFTSLLGMELGVATLTQVEQQIAPAKLSHSRASGHYLASLCYRAKSQVVQFISGEAGGANLKLLAFALRPANTLKDCAPLPRKFASRLQLGGLMLGMNKATFTKTVGANVTWQSDMAQVQFQDQRKLNDAEISKYPPEKQVALATGRTKNYFDVSIALIGTFAGDRLVAIEVWKTETL